MSVDQVFITFVAGVETPENLRHVAGRRMPVPPNSLVPAPGTMGRLFGRYGVMRDGESGPEWELLPEPEPEPDPAPSWARDLAARLERIETLIKAREA